MNENSVTMSLADGLQWFMWKFTEACFIYTVIRFYNKLSINQISCNWKGALSGFKSDNLNS